MTIAAGFVCKDGVVLCADTHHTGAVAAKTHHAKLGSFVFPGGKIVFAVAGNRNLAWSAVQKLRTTLAGTPPENTLAVMEEVLDEEYRKNVFSNPSYSTGVYDYWLLIALWEPMNWLHLYATSQNSVRQIDGFECIGIGAELANYLITPCFELNMYERRTINLATYALANVKDSVEGCGGPTIFHILRKDGSLGTATTQSNPWDQIEKFSKTFDFLTRRMFLGLTDLETDDSNCEKNLGVYCAELMKARAEWSRIRGAWKENFANLNPHLTSSQVTEAYLRLTMGLSPIPPPLPESPGGTDESASPSR